jgi:MYXO-CTERM domain-containing protein
MPQEGKTMRYSRVAVCGSVRKRAAVFAAASAIVACAGNANAGPDWVERGDAGSNTGNSQIIDVEGQLRSIGGTLGGNALIGDDQEDCYFFSITDPNEFFISVSGTGIQLSLFTLEPSEDNALFARGLLAGQSANGRAKLSRFSTDFTEAEVTEPGDYMLSISFVGRQPESFGGPIFSFASATEVSGPDGPGGGDILTGWSESVALPMIQYSLQLSGSAGSTIPTPGAAAMLGLAGLAAVRRRR